MLADWLSQRRAAILQRWFARVVETYPADAGKFLQQQSDPFSNPVGQTIRRGLEALLDQLLLSFDAGTTASTLEDVIRIRAVQDFSPSQAVGFLFSLKEIVRQELNAEGQASAAAEWPAFEARIDRLALLAFDVYMHCREKVFEIRVSEMKRASYLWQRAHPEFARPPQDGEIRISMGQASDGNGGHG
jgi:hypothetical protein